MLTQTVTSTATTADAPLLAPSATALARGTLSEYTTAIGLRALLNRTGTPLFVLDTDRIANNYAFFAALLPDAQLRYALAALPHPAVIRTIAAEGAGFDVVSTGELAMLTHEGVAASGAVYSHPIKRPSDIQAAYDAGVRRFVVDNPAEVRKFAHLASDVRLLVRLRFDQASSPTFGVDPEHALNLVRFAATCGITVAGFSVHLALQPNATTGLPLLTALEHALQQTLTLIDSANEAIGSAGGDALDTIDIGGGIPAAHDMPAHEFAQLATVIERALAPRMPAVALTVALGHCIAAPAMLLATSVIGQASRDGEVWHYLDDGLHGSFAGVRGSATPPKIVSLDELEHSTRTVDGETGSEARSYPTTLAGASTDGIDVIARDIELPPLAIGDVLICPNFGAYSLVMSSNFEAMHRTRVHVLRRRTRAAVL